MFLLNKYASLLQKIKKTLIAQVYVFCLVITFRKENKISIKFARLLTCLQSSNQFYMHIVSSGSSGKSFRVVQYKRYESRSHEQKGTLVWETLALSSYGLFLLLFQKSQILNYNGGVFKVKCSTCFLLRKFLLRWKINMHHKICIKSLLSYPQRPQLISWLP